MTFKQRALTRDETRRCNELPWPAIGDDYGRRREHVRRLRALLDRIEIAGDEAARIARMLDRVRLPYSVSSRWDRTAVRRLVRARQIRLLLPRIDA